MLALQTLPSNPLTEAACEAAGPPHALELPVLVEPSTAPTTIVFMVGEAIIPVTVSLTSFRVCFR